MNNSIEKRTAVLFERTGHLLERGVPLVKTLETLAEEVLRPDSELIRAAHRPCPKRRIVCAEPGSHEVSSCGFVGTDPARGGNRETRCGVERHFRADRSWSVSPGNSEGCRVAAGSCDDPVSGRVETGESADYRSSRVTGQRSSSGARGGRWVVCVSALMVC